MKNDYRTFRLSLLTLAPIHIGNGEKYTSREFIYENKKFYFPDMGKFYNQMIEKRLAEKFEAFLIQTRPNARNNRLISFLNDNRIAERSFGGYSISETGLEILIQPELLTKLISLFVMLLVIPTFLVAH